jgi:ABC-type transport system substrate-binding protein
MNKKALKVSFILAMACCFVFSASAIFASEPKFGGTLRIGIKTPQYSRIDVRHPGPAAVGPAYFMIYDGLVLEGPKGTDLIPGLATSWETKDNKVWIFHIRKGVKFHNGKELTAKDVEENFEWLIQLPKGWKPMRNRGLLRGLQNAEAMDKYTVKVTLKRPFSQFPHMLAMAMRGIAPAEEVYKWNKEFYKHAVGTGPFKVVNAESQNKLVLERNDYYWGPRPHVDRLEYVFIRSDDARVIALQKGELDFIVSEFNSMPILKKDPNIDVEQLVNYTTHGKYYLNVRRWPMSDVRFRKALWQAVDWKTIAVNTSPNKSGRYVSAYLNNTPYESQENLGLVPNFNPEEAKKLVKAVEKDAGEKIPPIKLILINKSPDKEIAELVKTSLGMIGVPVNIKMLSFVNYSRTLGRDKKMDWDIGGHAHGFNPSPSRGFTYFVTNSRTGADGKSIGGYSNPEFDKWVKIFESATDRNQQIKAAQEAEKVLIKDVACIPMKYNIQLVAWRKAVKGVKNNALCGINVTTAWGANMWIDK